MASSVLTTKQSVETARQFLDQITSPAGGYYAFAGRPTPWDNESVPETSVDSVEVTELSLYEDLAYGKRLTSADVILATRRIDWTSGTVYDPYAHDDGSLYQKSFYVKTSENKVFKCIDNGSGAESTIEPKLNTTSGVFSTSDGYVWKYMFSIEAGDASRFMTTDYLPVVANAAVSANAVPGSIEFVSVTGAGEDYQAHHSGFLQGFVNSQVVSISTDASPFDGLYVGSSIYLSTGLGSGQLREITGYIGGDRSVVVDDAFDTYVSLIVDSPSGNITSGQILTQRSDTASYLYRTGYFNVSDEVYQSDTLATGSILSANSTKIVISKDLDSPADFLPNYPIIETSTSAVLCNGTMTVSASSNVVTGVSTLFSTELAVGSYIRPGANVIGPVRRVTAITNATSLTVDSAFPTTLATQAVYSVPTALYPTGVTVARATGDIVEVNLTGVEIQMDSPTPLGVSYIPGEKVTMVDTDSISIGANGIVASSNSSVMVISDVSGTFTSGTSDYSVKAVSIVANTGTAYANGDVVSLVANASLTTYASQFIVTTSNTGVPVSVLTSNSGSYSSNIASLSAGLTTGGTGTGLQLTAIIKNNEHYVLGGSSGVASRLALVTSKPTILVQSESRIFRAGQTAYTQTFLGANAYSGSVTIAASPTYFPSELTEYIISPTVTIDGDGIGATAYSIVDSANTVSGISVVTPGEGYGWATAAITSNSSFGSGATAKPILSPAAGHGSNAVMELGARYVTIAPKFDVAENESYAFQNGQYRRVGILKDPLFYETLVTVSDYDRIKLTINNKNSNTFTVGEVVIQSSANATGRVVFANTTFLELQNVMGTFVANTAGDDLYAFSSATTANTRVAAPCRFSISSNNETVVALTSGAQASLTQVANTVLRLTDIKGTLSVGDSLYQASTNSVAVISSMAKANGAVDVSSSYGLRFSQLSRMTLQSNSGAFQVGEAVIQDLSLASGRVDSVSSDYDISIGSANGSFQAGNILTGNTSGANGLVTFANSTYLKVTATTGGPWANSETIINNLGSTAVATQVFPALIVSGIDTRFQIGNNSIVGQTTGASAKIGLPNSVTQPDLIKDTGALIYVASMEPFTRSANTRETVRLVVKF